MGSRHLVRLGFEFVLSLRLRQVVTVKGRELYCRPELLDFFVSAHSTMIAKAIVALPLLRAWLVRLACEA